MSALAATLIASQALVSPAYADMAVPVRDRVKRYLGQPEQEVQAAARAAGIPVRIGSRDGLTFAVTLDLVPQRWTLTVTKGMVTQIEFG